MNRRHCHHRMRFNQPQKSQCLVPTTRPSSFIRSCTVCRCNRARNLRAISNEIFSSTRNADQSNMIKFRYKRKEGASVAATRAEKDATIEREKPPTKTSVVKTKTSTTAVTIAKEIPETNVVDPDYLESCIRAVVVSRSDYEIFPCLTVNAVITD